ncbi:hypothetical protein V8F06_005199 [Rhypophila decipiens]
MNTVAPPVIPRPIAAAHIMIFPEGHLASEIPVNWSQIRFDAVDVLYIHGFSTSDDGKFILGDQKNNLEKRLEWVMTAAKNLNPEIRFFAQQNWSGNNILERGLDAFPAYAESVVHVLQRWRLHGYDIDYEPGTALPDIPKLFQHLHTQCSPRGFLVSITPAEYRGLFDPNKDQHLEQNVLPNYIDLVSLQTYDGGLTRPNELSQWLRVFPANKILVAGWPEGVGFPDKRDWNWSVQNIKTAYETGRAPGDTGAPIAKLAGIHQWRLNSDNLIWENATQVMFYNYLHAGSGRKLLPTAWTPKVIEDNWKADHKEVHNDWKGT